MIIGARTGRTQRERQELDRRRATGPAQQRHLDAVAEQRLELRAVADETEALSQPVRTGQPTPPSHSRAMQPGPFAGQQYSRINDHAIDVLRLQMVYT